MFSLDEIEAVLDTRGLQCRRRGSRKIVVAGQQSARAVVLRSAHPDRASIATMKLEYRDDWPTAIAVLHALMSIMGPVTAQMRLFDLLIDPQRSVAQLCSDYRAALDADIERGMNFVTEAGTFMRRVSEQLPKGQQDPDS